MAASYQGPTSATGTLWIGLFAPTGEPADVLNTLHTAMAKLLASKDLRDKLEQQGVELAAPADKPVTPDRFASILSQDLENWARVVKQSGASVD